MKNSIFTILLAIFFGVPAINASVVGDIEKATKSGKTIFLVVTEPGNIENTGALNLCKQAKKLQSNSVVIEMNRKDLANESLITKYKLAGAPLPLILIIASNGIPAGGVVYNKQTTDKENLIAMVPTSKKADVLKIINEGKSVFVVVSKKSMKKQDVLSKCEIACAEMKENAKIVEIDFDDPKEKKFLGELKITDIGETPQTYVINNQGQVAGTFTGVTDSKKLVATASKRPSAGCCPSGSGKSCAPKK